MTQKGASNSEENEKINYWSSEGEDSSEKKQHERFPSTEHFPAFKEEFDDSNN